MFSKSPKVKFDEKKENLYQQLKKANYVQLRNHHHYLVENSGQFHSGQKI